MHEDANEMKPIVPTYKVWARVGMSAELTEEEIQDLKDTKDFAKYFFNQRFNLDGETYFPEMAEQNNLVFEDEFEITLD